MAKINIDNINIEYEIIGNSGPILALMPGARRGYLEMKTLAEKISKNNIRVLLHDRRNTGASDMLLDDNATEEVVWADELHNLFKAIGEEKVFVSGSSSGARTALMYALRHPESLLGLIIMRVTGGKFAAQRLPVNYYKNFIDIARKEGMEGVAKTPRFLEYIATNPSIYKNLINMDKELFIKVQTNLLDKFLNGAELPVMGITESELNSIKVPSLVIPGNDNTHNSESGKTASVMLGNSELHELPIEDVDVDLIPWSQWYDYENEISNVMSRFINNIAS